MDMISLAQRSVVPIHLMKELVFPHRKKILEIFRDFREYSSEIVSSRIFRSLLRLANYKYFFKKAE
jgi:hypothetical protein